MGSINMDLVIRAPRFPQAGESVLGGEFATFPGGKGANQAVAAARMGAAVTMIGRVGDDSYGVEMRRVLEAEGIDASDVLTTKGTPTGVAVITVAEGGGNTIVVAPGANARVTTADVESAREKIEAADVVLMQLEVPLETVARAAEIARSFHKCVVLNAAPAQQLPHPLLELVDVLIVNETEGELVSAGAQARRGISISRATVSMVGGEPRNAPAPETVEWTRTMLSRLAALGPGSVIATFGEAGAAWIHDGHCAMIDACRVQAIDTVGAGDAFCGTIAATWPSTLQPTPSVSESLMGLLSARLMGPESRAAESVRAELAVRNEPFIALQMAVAAGALATTKQGAIPSLPNRSQVEDFLKCMPQ